jgi:hypothetical protein
VRRTPYRYASPARRQSTSCTVIRSYVVSTIADALARVDLAGKLDAIEARLARLEQRAAPAGPPNTAPAADALWAIEELKRRAAQDAILFTGTVTLPTGEHYEWQETRRLDDLLVADPSASAAVLDAMAHPIRLLILQHVLRGLRTVSALGTLEEVGTTGQLYHHLRHLVAQGWLVLLARGQYQVPPPRVIPLLVAIAAARR